MNIAKIFNILLDEAVRQQEQAKPYEAELGDRLTEVNRRRRKEFTPPSDLSEQSILEAARAQLKDDVSLVSCVMNYHFPEEFVFWRTGFEDTTILDGLSMLAPFTSALDDLPREIHRRDIDGYVRLNSAVQVLRRDVELSPDTMHEFLYGGIVTLLGDFQTPRGTGGWLSISQQGLPAEAGELWSGRPGVSRGDVYFYYETKPRSAITAIGVVTEDPYYDPWGAWGYWATVQLRHELASPITMAQMKQDPVMSQWSAVRGSMQGLVTVPIPPLYWNRLLDFVGASVAEELGLQRFSAASADIQAYASEREFEEEVLVPLARRAGFVVERQVPCRFYMGSQVIPGRVDLLLTQGGDKVALVEAKRTIQSDAQREAAYQQGRSYSLQLGLTRFAVAAPEGIWFYSVSTGQKPVESLSIAQAESDPSRLRELLV